jgi:hypothetical protein
MTIPAKYNQLDEKEMGEEQGLEERTKLLEKQR